MKKNIFIILPYKESLNPNQAGAVSLYVKDTTKLSKFKNKIKIISSDDVDKSRLFRNKNYIINFCEKYKNTKINIIEIHNRPEYLIYIKKYFPKTKINLIFHNDPLSLRGSIKKNERENIISSCHKVVFISKWIQKRFFSSVKNVNFSNTIIIPHGISKKKINLAKKEKNILFVAKLNEAKGYHIFCDAALKFKKFDSSWNFIAIGNEARKNIFPNPKIVKEIGYKKNSEVLKYYEKSEIAIGNSVWNEPLGRIAIESSSRKCLPIISNKGGLEESKNIAIVLKKNNSKELFHLLKKITRDKIYRRRKQKLFFDNNDFDLKKISSTLDTIRSNVFNLINDTVNSNTKKRILHIANFNENADGRLFYSFANKLNNGFIKNNDIVQTISDRFFLKSNRSLLQLFNPFKKFNEKIMNTIKNFSPNLLIIGHVFNIDKSIFLYCKKNNIKIVSWYIDSISPEFLKNKSKMNFFRNLELIDYCFLTSSPYIFRSHKFYKKLKFIPNPIDSSIDSYVNFDNKNLEHDMFVAISHGQNRGILKKGKSDEREKLIKDLIFELPEIKFASFGIDKFEPIWGSNYYYYLSKSKMGLNISRGSYQKLYSSDRISSLIGNGLLVFINSNTEFQKLFTEKEVVFYKNKNDLINKIKYFSLNDKDRIKYAQLAYKKYHMHMNNKIISNYILNCVGLRNTKKPFWHDIN